MTNILGKLKVYKKALPPVKNKIFYCGLKTNKSSLVKIPYVHGETKARAKTVFQCFRAQLLTWAYCLYTSQRVEAKHSIQMSTNH